MPDIYDNITTPLLGALRSALEEAVSADFCVGYFNLRGWGNLADLVDCRFDGVDDRRVRVLIGMERPPHEEMRLAQQAVKQEMELDGPTAARLKRRTAEGFKEQLEFGLPSAHAETALQQLARQLRAGKLQTKIFLPYSLHAKLYLVHRADRHTPLLGYLGSSNLTQAGLRNQGELNVDVFEQDAATKLQRWFDDRWNDPFALDVSDELATLIETSWAREELISPYLVYLKMIYHLSEEARRGQREFKLPRQFQGVLLDFQAAAVSLAAHHVHRRGGVLLGDVVGLGKTLMACAIARIFQEDEGINTLILCPPNLKPMWEQHVQRYDLVARVMSTGKTLQELPNLPRYRLVIIDESQNLRNREGRRYRAIRDYIESNEARCLLLSATPYNKQFTDIGNQLRLFVDEDRDLGIRPERFFDDWTSRGFNEADFRAQFQASPRSMRAFEQSAFADDWRNLMRLYMVRRTRRFIIANYANHDSSRDRHYVLLNGQPSYFPLRDPRNVTFAIDDHSPNDQYAHMYRDDVVDVIQHLMLPRYGLANYLSPRARKAVTTEEKRTIENLNRAGRRLIGFSRTNLFKRLESSGHSFLLSLHRHALRNLVTLHALERGLPIPIGTQHAAMLDTSISDADADWAANDIQELQSSADADANCPTEDSLQAYRGCAARVYTAYRDKYRNRFQWLSPRLFHPDLHDDLLADATALLQLAARIAPWNPDRDAKLDALYNLLSERHADDKVLVFTQFADTALYLARHLQQRGITHLAAATAQNSDPTALALRFSPRSNEYTLRPHETELRVLIATDVLAEGQNLQDCAIVVNYDLPWAIVRIIQRAGRVDRIGQRADTIMVYSFLPADGVDRVIHLRTRLCQRLQDNQEVIGTDESFFGEAAAEKLRDLYTEKVHVLDEDDDDDVDLTSMALQVWNSAPEHLRHQAEALPPVVYATRAHQPIPSEPAGVLAYLRFPNEADVLVRVDESGNTISQSIVAILNAAACSPETPALSRRPDHHDLTARAVDNAVAEVTNLGGQLGSLRSTRRKLYERLRAFREELVSAYRDTSRLDGALNAIFRSPLTEAARETIGRQLRLGIPDTSLTDVVLQLAEDGRLTRVPEDTSETPQPTIVCSIGLRPDVPLAPGGEDA